MGKLRCCDPQLFHHLWFNVAFPDWLGHPLAGAGLHRPAEGDSRGREGKQAHSLSRTVYM